MLSEENNTWEGGILGIATCHGKEHQIGPVFSEAFGFSWEVPTPLQTDLLGTFTGEISRQEAPVEAAKRKIAMGRVLRPDILYWVASEGSFGPHPTIGFLPADEEWLVFQDFSRPLEISARVISLATNYQIGWFDTWQDLLHFARTIGFPEHALILRPSESILAPMVKGIQNEGQLYDVFNTFLAKFGGAFAQTDMRAMVNPSRQAVIQEAARTLVKQLQSKCPACQTPGYSISDTQGGLPCSWCGQPTRSRLAAVWSCSACNFSNTQRYPDGRTEEDPGLCDYCNP